MLTTEMIQGLIEGKTYSRLSQNGNPLFIKLCTDKVMMRSGNVPWQQINFYLADLQGDWNEVIEWQEIDWKEAVDCDSKGIPIQYATTHNLADDKEEIESWHDAPRNLSCRSISFVRDLKWRKKVEVK